VRTRAFLRWVCALD